MLRENPKPLHDALNRSGFRPEDFAITTSQQGKDVVDLVIAYRIEPQFRFVATIQRASTSEYHFAAEASPGYLFDTEVVPTKSASDLIGQISAWVDRIDMELKSRPRKREIIQQQEEIDRLLKEFDQIGDGYFTAGEIKEVVQRLDDMETRFTAHLLEHAGNEKDAHSKTQALQQDIAVLKSRLTELNKQGWLKTLALRAGTWLQDPLNRNLFKSSADVAKAFLLFGVEQE